METAFAFAFPFPTTFPFPFPTAFPFPCGLAKRELQRELERELEREREREREQAGAASRCPSGSLDTPCARRGGGGMLRIYPFIIETIALLRPELLRIERRDPDLARQMRRALASIALNTAEGEGSRGRNQQARFHTAMGSARESLACLDVAVALGYTPEQSRELRDRLDRIVGTLNRLARPSHK